MCDQANHDNCEILDELNLVITNLEMTIADLKAEFLEDITGCWTWIDGKTRVAKSSVIKEIEKKWRAK